MYTNARYVIARIVVANNVRTTATAKKHVDAPISMVHWIPSGVFAPHIRLNIRQTKVAMARIAPRLILNRRWRKLLFIRLFGR